MVDQGPSTNVGELSAQSPSTQRQDAFAEYIQTYGFKSFVSSLVRAASVFLMSLLRKRLRIARRFRRVLLELPVKRFVARHLVPRSVSAAKLCVILNSHADAVSLVLTAPGLASARPAPVICPRRQKSHCLLFFASGDPASYQGPISSASRI